MENSIGIVTYFNDVIGHHLGDVVGKRAAAEGKTVREVIHEMELLFESEVERNPVSREPRAPEVRGHRRGVSAALTACAYDRGRGTHVGTPASSFV